jgi:hypothetical protein
MPSVTVRALPKVAIAEPRPLSRESEQFVLLESEFRPVPESGESCPPYFCDKQSAKATLHSALAN